MKKFFSYFFTLTSLAVFGQEIIDKEVGTFNEIKVYDLIEVNLIQSEENRILIKGENVHDINWVNKEGILKLRMEFQKKFSGDKTLIEVHYTRLDVIDGNEGARLTGNETIQQDHIELRAQEGARIRVGLDVDEVDIRAVTGGIVEAAGLARRQAIVLNTGGIFEGRELKTASSSVKISAGGEAELHATDRVDIDVKAGGNVNVYGKPEQVNKNTFAGGQVHFKD